MSGYGRRLNPQATRLGAPDVGGPLGVPAPTVRRARPAARRSTPPMPARLLISASAQPLRTRLGPHGRRPDSPARPRRTPSLLGDTPVRPPRDSPGPTDAVIACARLVRGRDPARRRRPPACWAAPPGRWRSSDSGSVARTRTSRCTLAGGPRGRPRTAAPAAVHAAARPTSCYACTEISGAYAPLDRRPASPRPRVRAATRSADRERAHPPLLRVLARTADGALAAVRRCPAPHGLRRAAPAIGRLEAPRPPALAEHACVDHTSPL
ncbi:hypothetical protein SVIOM342S_07903 [Streptomyces violaceorubidus]